VAALQCIGLAPLSLGLHFALVRARAEARRAVSGVSVGYDMCVGGDLGGREDLHRARIIVSGVSEAHAPVGLGRHQNELLVRAALSPDERLVHLHERAERLAVGAHHRRTQLVQPCPRRLVGAKAHDPLQVLGRDAVAAGADLENRAKPYLEGLPRLLQQRARRQARLMAAVRTLEQEAVALAPHSRRATARTRGRVAPARLDPVGAAVLFRREARLEFCRCLREVTPQAVVG